MKKLTFFITVLIFSPAFSVVKINLANQNSTVEFLAIGKPSFLKIEGTGGTLTGQIEVDGNVIKGEARVNVNNFTTGIDLRDKHMKEKYLETSKYPEAILTITKIVLPLNFMAQKTIFKSVSFTGTLTLHGKSNEVTGLADVDNSGSPMTVNTEFKTSLAAYDIQIPTYMGIKVADEVVIKTLLKTTL